MHYKTWTSSVWRTVAVGTARRGTVIVTWGGNPPWTDCCWGRAFLTWYTSKCTIDSTQVSSDDVTQPFWHVPSVHNTYLFVFLFFCFCTFFQHGLLLTPLNTLSSSTSHSTITSPQHTIAPQLNFILQNLWSHSLMHFELIDIIKKKTTT